MVLIVITVLVGIIIILPETVFYAVRWIINGRSFPEIPIIIRLLFMIPFEKLT